MNIFPMAKIKISGDSMARTYTKKSTTKYFKKKTTSQRKRMYNNSIAAIVKRELYRNAESKHLIGSHTQVNNGTTTTSPTGFYDLNHLSEGTEENQRIGNMVQPTRLDVRGCIRANHHTAQYHKILIVECNQQSNPLLDLLEDNTGTYAPAANDLRAIYARINTTKYRIVGQRILKTGTMSTQVDDFGSTAMFNINIPLKGKMNYEDALAVAQKRRLVLVVISREANNPNPEGPGHNVALTWNSKFYFKDI